MSRIAIPGWGPRNAVLLRRLPGKVCWAAASSLGPFGVTVPFQRYPALPTCFRLMPGNDTITIMARHITNTTMAIVLIVDNIIA